MNRTSCAFPAIAAALLLATASGVAAQTRPVDVEPVPDGPPPPPPRVKSGEALDPPAPATGRKHESIAEYRVNGHLRAIRVDPGGFPAYWLIDADGDGWLDAGGTAWPGGRDGGLDSAGELRPYWMIFSW